MSQALSYAALRLVRVRIRSWKDILLIFIAGGIAVGLEYVFEQKLDMEERKAKLLAYAIALIACLIILFAGDSD